MRNIFQWGLFCMGTLLSLSLFAADDEGWVLRTDSRENYTGVTLANGRIGMVADASVFSLKEVVLNGVFDKEYQGGVSRMVRGPLFTNLTLKIDGEKVADDQISHWKQELDMKEAVLRTSFSFKGVNVTYALRAMRNLPYMGMGEVTVYASRPVNMELVNEVSFPDELQQPRVHFKVMRDSEVYLPVYVSESTSRTGMQHLVTCTAFWLKNEERKKVIQQKGQHHTAMSYACYLKSGETCRVPLMGAVCSSRDFSDPKGEAERMVVYALQHPLETLIDGHRDCWKELWRGDIQIEGCLSDQLDVRLALYHLYAFQCAGSRLSISPMGLSSSMGYNGHVFWDSELWMLPSVLLFHPELARCHIDYRADRLDKALQRASLFGYKGAMFPWESDDSGEEATPTWCLTGTFEHHITADIGIAFWNYYRVTRNLAWLRREGFPVIRAVADFWVSRATAKADGTFSILNVVGANEYAPNVDDNAFTNGAAKVALQNAVKAAQLLGEPVDPRWRDVAEGLRFHYMPDGTMKEHADYQGSMIKQADVNLLAYPLGLIHDKEAIRRDLAYYEDKIDKVNGPAMGNSILSILYSRMGDEEKAYERFHLSYYPNKRHPFGVLSESAASNNPYFATGAGGMLQAVLFGFAGMEITDEGLIQQKPMLPKAWKSLTLKGVGPERKTIKVKR